MEEDGAKRDSVFDREWQDEIERQHDRDTERKIEVPQAVFSAV